MNRSSKRMRDVIVIFLSVIIMSAWISSADASGQTFVSPVRASPVPAPIGEVDTDRNYRIVRIDEIAQPEKPARLSGLACIIVARAWFVDEDVCH
jgi:hypothetical protein